ncbi:Protein trichome birefringence-like 19 [Striga hermonthica]|uniref:Protein trichome birefringence-like 19 n=1 Tax=Striga hermonthica TaxID=68872 RepID=A0A9N7MNX8_STRHE|nr:Protein trichome birefringence-like 19 [Striga hermonthica]
MKMISSRVTFWSCSIYVLAVTGIDFGLSSSTDGFGFSGKLLIADHWFSRTTVYYEFHQVVGCRYIPDIADLRMSYVYHRAFRTTFAVINRWRGFDCVAILQTLSSSHFENGLWKEDADCVRRQPFDGKDTILERVNFELYVIWEELGGGEDWEDFLFFFSD